MLNTDKLKWNIWKTIHEKNLVGLKAIKKAKKIRRLMRLRDI